MAAPAGRRAGRRGQGATHSARQAATPTSAALARPKRVPMPNASTRPAASTPAQPMKRRSSAASCTTSASSATSASASIDAGSMPCFETATSAPATSNSRGLSASASTARSTRRRWRGVKGSEAAKSMNGPPLTCARCIQAHSAATASTPSR